VGPLLISRVAIANCLGLGLRAVLDALLERRSGLALCAFDNVSLDTYVGEVARLDEYHVDVALAAYDSRNNRLAQLALEQDGFSAAVARARDTHGARRIGVIVGTSTSGILEAERAYRRRDPRSGALPADFRYAETQNYASLADFVQRYLGLSGPAYVVSSACSSTAKVFASAARLMAAGVIDAAVVGGADSLCLTTLYGFNSLGLVSRAPCRPFDAARDGISIGEGAGFALLERAPGSLAARAITLLGVGESSDAYHMSAPHPEGAGARLAMRRALESAGLAPTEIDYVNLHGTATQANDASEDKAMLDVFGPTTPCSSTKGWTGHLLGAAGITEAIICILGMENDLIPGSLHTTQVDPALRCNYQLQNLPRRLTRVMSNSFGFGGSNCSLVLGCEA
jgi:3-oxoacyl-[acyl-carrier-protein] synthase-1